MIIGIPASAFPTQRNDIIGYRSIRAAVSLTDLVILKLFSPKGFLNAN